MIKSCSFFPPKMCFLFDHYASPERRVRKERQKPALQECMSERLKAREALISQPLHRQDLQPDLKFNCSLEISFTCKVSRAFAHSTM